MSQTFNHQYLQLLSKQYPSIDAVSTEIINLSAILSLPKGTEHFLADLHGEYEAFDHVLRNASGVVNRKIDDTFGQSLTADEKKQLATLVYYPKEKLVLHKEEMDEKTLEAWYKTTIYQLILLCRSAAYKYTRSKVRKSLPQSFAYIIEELFHEDENSSMKQGYYQTIIDSIVTIERADEFIVSITSVIRRLVIDELHIIGDIYDRGPGAHHIMDLLLDHHQVDVQWGNHDILWMAAAAGSQACIANALRIAFRYGNLETIEEGYGINLSPLIRFTLSAYQQEYPSTFCAKVKDDVFKDNDIELLSRMQKAIAVIQFKLEGQIIKRRKEFDMDDRLHLDMVDTKDYSIVIDGEKHFMNDSYFPTIDWSNPYALTEEEASIMERLAKSFKQSEKLQRHVDFLYRVGAMYKVHNNNLLYHSCIPLDDQGEFSSYHNGATSFKGKGLLDYFESKARKGYYSNDPLIQEEALDNMWYIWCGAKSPLFGKDKMATFERYFIDDKTCHKEVKNPYFAMRSEEATCVKILKAFNLDPKYAHIINGHVPVKVVKGEVPIKAGGKLICIDGGFSKAYQGTTGIAGYTLIFNSQGMSLVSHEPFESREKAIKEDIDVLPTTVFIEKDLPRVYVGDTDNGIEIKESIIALKALLKAYYSGAIEQRI